VGFFGKAFTLVPGLLIWLACLGWGVYSLMGHWDDLSRRAGGVLSVENLPLLYVAFTLIKAIHEFGHAFACKKFGEESGSGGEVHIMGIMFLVFTPMPYVDASSSWAFRSKWHRMIVGAAGMYVEMAVAGLAAVVWANTSAGAVNAIAYNVMFIASVSTVIFNANPLLRYDGYYMLSDVLEIPNLAQRGKEYLYYLVKKYAWGVRQAQNPSHSPGERAWLLSYALCSTVYRWFICVAILLFVAGALFIVGLVLAVAAVIAWVCVPIGKFIYYLASNPELARVRPRAVISTLGVLGGLLAALGAIPVPDRYRMEAVVAPAEYAIIHADAEGFVGSVLPSGTTVAPRQDVLAGADNPQLKAELELLLLERKRLELQIAAQTTDINARQIAQGQLAALAWPTEWRKRRVEALQTVSPMAGTWVSPEIDRLKGGYVRRGDSLGIVAGLDNLIIRAVASQEAAPVLIEEMDVKGNLDVFHVEIMVRGRPDDKLSGQVEKVLAAGENDLPSEALGMEAGGSVPTVQEGRRPGSQARATERFFEVRILPGQPASPSHPVKLYSGQRVIVRISAPAKPLMQQWYRALMQLVQRKFHV
jgi:putative peptide zinc metalloprotease protein